MRCARMALKEYTCISTMPAHAPRPWYVSCYLKGIKPKKVQLITIFKGCLPFVSMVFLAIVMVYVFPQLVFWLPELFYSR